MGNVTREEIISQPDVWKKAIERLDSEGFGFPNIFPEGPGMFIGAGTSLYLSRTLAHFARAISGKNFIAVPPSDILTVSEDYIGEEKPWVVGISRSGTTTETVRALQLLREKYEILTNALSCHSSSEMAQNASDVIAVDEAAEKSVVMTRSFTTMMIAMQRWLLKISGESRLMELQKKLPNIGSVLVKNRVDEIAKIVSDLKPDHIVTFGQGAYYGLACEIALKVKEMAIMPSEPFHTLEYRHGPKSIAGPGTFVIALLSDRGKSLEKDVLSDIKKLGAKIWAITESSEGLDENHADYITVLDSDLPEMIRLPLILPILQLYGLELAISRNINPDAPQNLTQVVTL